MATTSPLKKSPPYAAVNKHLTAARASIRRYGLPALLLFLPVFLFLLALGLGRYPITIADVGRVLLSPLFPGVADHVDQTAALLVLRIRLPRALAALLIGASLASTGAAFQGIFKNPLVDSNILGVTSGAGFGAALALLLLAPAWLVQTSAFFFGLLAVSLAFFGSRLYHSAPILVLTLMGILVGSLFGSLTSLLKYVADPLDALPAITFWLLGSLASVTWRSIPALLLITAVGALFLWLVRWRLNVLSLGEAEAATLGMNPTRLKLAIIVTATLMTAVAVSISGVIGWVGLVIPHAGRILVGPDHKRLIPATLSLGASFLLLIDLIARTLLPGEVPLGVLTGLIGVPILIVLLRRNRTGW
ncbi:MAG: iron ABC transporter permease [Chloroflexi bacterium]|nr:iron ABC transporter permease [Chloroflexota bacterium]